MFFFMEEPKQREQVQEGGLERELPSFLEWLVPIGASAVTYGLCRLAGADATVTYMTSGAAGFSSWLSNYFVSANLYKN